MSLRREFVALAKGHGISVTELARRFGISRKTAYKWLRREAASEPLSDRSRRRVAAAKAMGHKPIPQFRRAAKLWQGAKIGQKRALSYSLSL